MQTRFEIRDAGDLRRLGDNLLGFLAAVRNEYLLRAPYDEYLCGLRQTNTVRVVACQVLERLPSDEQRAIIQDLYELDSVRLLRDDPREVFLTSDSVGSHIFDLACEVVWQILVCDVEIRIEDEIRIALAEA